MTSDKKRFKQSDHAHVPVKAAVSEMKLHVEKEKKIKKQKRFKESHHTRVPVKAPVAEMKLHVEKEKKIKKQKHFQVKVHTTKNPTSHKHRQLNQFMGKQKSSMLLKQLQKSSIVINR